MSKRLEIQFIDKKLTARLDSQNGGILEQLSVLMRVMTRMRALREWISQPETQAELIKQFGSRAVKDRLEREATDELKVEDIPF